ncbi:hypothetical protein M422DRAFT_43602 [Sphaerobolus stellatus SS14]|nr:hypothetical protein M422DRAFT_43602 [Sphaerobolus stellatus SS14]
MKSYEAFVKNIQDRFMPKGYQLIALRAFFLCSQGRNLFAECAAALAEARNAPGEAIINAELNKYRLLFHSHTLLLLRIMAMPDFDIASIAFDNLASLMAIQPQHSGCTYTSSDGTSYANGEGLLPPPFTDTERKALTAGGYWRWRKAPTDIGWIVGRTCPGDPTRGIFPGRDHVSPPVVKREVVGMALYDHDDFDAGGEDQPEPVKPRDDNTDSDY